MSELDWNDLLMLYTRESARMPRIIWRLPKTHRLQKINVNKFVPHLIGKVFCTHLLHPMCFERISYDFTESAEKFQNRHSDRHPTICIRSDSVKSKPMRGRRSFCQHLTILFLFSVAFVKQSLFKQIKHS